MRPRVIVVLAALALSGCSASVHVSLGDNALDLGKLRRAITKTIQTQFAIHTRVTCPHPVVKKGRTFMCAAHLAVGVYPITVRILDNDGHVHYGNPAPLQVLDSRVLEQSIEATILAQRHHRVTARCPSPILQGKGINFTCTVRSGALHDVVDVTQTNADGHVHFSAR